MAKPQRVRLLKLLGVGREAVRFVWRSAPKEVRWVALLTIITGIILPAQVFVAKLAVDSIGGIARDGGDLSKGLPAIVVFFVLAAIGRFLTPYAATRQRVLAELVTRRMQEQLATKALALDLEHFEDPSFQDRLSRAQGEGARPTLVVNQLMAVLGASVTVISFVVLLLRIEPFFVLVLAAAQVPAWLANTGSSRAMYHFTWRRTPEERQIRYLSSIMTTIDPAKEVRMFGVGDYLLKRLRALFESRLAELRQVVRDRLVRLLIAALISTAATGLGIWLVLRFYEAGRISLSDVGAILAVILLGSDRLRTVITAASQLYESALFIDDYWSFLDIPPTTLSVLEDPVPTPESFDRLSMQNVSFTYPDTDEEVLHDVSIEIDRGQVVALVGENGAGKSTIAKLLCRLYDPTEGAIRWDRHDIRDFDPSEYRARIAPMFQDFSRYLLSARDNIGFGDVSRIADDEAIEEAARRAGAHEIIGSLPNGYESILGRYFFGGHELSRGQWQRVALARAFMRDAPLVVLDEPTAALDPRREAALVATLRTLFEGRTVVLISHRLSSVRIADHIYVLNEGRLVEDGDHEHLMREGGLYSELFSMQAAAYIDIGMDLDESSDQIMGGPP